MRCPANLLKPMKCAAKFAQKPTRNALYHLELYGARFITRVKVNRAMEKLIRDVLKGEARERKCASC